jgi:DNA-binding response OmpR family regulator
MKILLVDDDRELTDILGFVLRRNGFDVVSAYSARGALEALEREAPALAVLDVNLGIESGFDLLARLRTRSDIPVIMLSGRGAEEDKVTGLDHGADDYLTKPFGHHELLARIRAQLRRRAAGGSGVVQETPPIECGPLRIDPAVHSLTVYGEPVKLGATEFRLLYCLMAGAGRVVPTAVIQRQVWGYEDPSGTDVARVTVHRVRRKLMNVGIPPDVLQTVPRVGVLFQPPSD